MGPTGASAHELIPLRPVIGIPAGGLDPDDYVQSTQLGLAEPESFTQYPPGPVPDYCQGQYLLRYDQAQARISESIIAEEYVQMTAPLGSLETKNG